MNLISLINNNSNLIKLNRNAPIQEEFRDDQGEGEMYEQDEAANEDDEANFQQDPAYYGQNFDGDERDEMDYYE